LPQIQSSGSKGRGTADGEQGQLDRGFGGVQTLVAHQMQRLRPSVKQVTDNRRRAPMRALLALPAHHPWPGC
jgi:hypothetical protein